MLCHKKCHVTNLLDDQTSSLFCIVYILYDLNFLFASFYFQFLLVFFLVHLSQGTTTLLNLEGEGLEEFVLDAKAAHKVSTLLKSSAERAKKNAPVIINQESELFKKYQQQRLPRRAAEQEKRSIYREDIVKITPAPLLHDDIKYKPSTPIPSLEVEIENNEVELENLLPVQNNFEVDDQEGKNLQEQLLEYEALKLPHPELQRTPIDSDLYSAVPNDHGLDQSLLQPEKSSYTSLGQFVRPIAPLSSSNYDHHYQQQEYHYYTTTSTTATPAPTKNQYKTDFGSYKTAPKPTEPTITTTTEVYTEPAAPAAPVIEANYNVIKPVKEQTNLNPERPQYTFAAQPLIDSYQPNQDTYQPPKQAYKPQQETYEYPSPSQESYQSYEPSQPSVTYQNQDSYESPPEVYQVYEAPQEPQYQEPYVVFKDHSKPVTTTVKPVVFKYEASANSDDQLAAPGNSYEVYEHPPPPPVPVQHVTVHHQSQDHVEQHSYVLPEPPKPHHVTSVYNHNQATAQSPKNPKHHLAANTPHPLVFGFKPIGSFLEDVFKPSRFPKNPLGNFLSQLPPPPRPPAPKKPHNYRQPKFFHRQPYQQQSNKAVHRFPLGLFY